jgi:antitoxin (DNA-binding transcriptional repressor) of toxin-antitoxin stability system
MRAAGKAAAPHDSERSRLRLILSVSRDPQRCHMKTVNVRELRLAIPNLKETLAREHELLLVSQGETVARILPAPARRHVPSLARHRAGMRTLVPGTIAVLLREGRDGA